MSKKYEVRKSDIHGLGLFATRRIKRGDVVGFYEGRETKKNGTHVLWVMQEDGSEIGVDGENELRFLNHSSRPNCAFHGTELTSLREIPKGKELTFHYGDDWA